MGRGIFVQPVLSAIDNLLRLRPDGVIPEAYWDAIKHVYAESLIGSQVHLVATALKEANRAWSLDIVNRLDQALEEIVDVETELACHWQQQRDLGPEALEKKRRLDKKEWLSKMESERPPSSEIVRPRSAHTQHCLSISDEVLVHTHITQQSIGGEGGRV